MFDEENGEEGEEEEWVIDSRAALLYNAIQNFEQFRNTMNGTSRSAGTLTESGRSVEVPQQWFLEILGSSCRKADPFRTAAV